MAVPYFCKESSFYCILGANFTVVQIGSILLPEALAALQGGGT